VEGFPDEGCLRGFEGGFREGAGVAPVRAIENCRKDERKVRKGKRRVAKKNDLIRKVGREISMNNEGRRKGKKNLKRRKKAKQRTNSPQRMRQAVKG